MCELGVLVGAFGVKRWKRKGKGRAVDWKNITKRKRRGGAYTRGDGHKYEVFRSVLQCVLHS
jgi:hypothetical protein